MAEITDFWALKRLKLESSFMSFWKQGIAQEMSAV
jgi:hypothetical protein